MIDLPPFIITTSNALFRSSPLIHSNITYSTAIQSLSHSTVNHFHINFSRIRYRSILQDHLVLTKVLRPTICLERAAVKVLLPLSSLDIATLYHRDRPLQLTADDRTGDQILHKPVHNISDPFDARDCATCTTIMSLPRDMSATTIIPQRLPRPQDRLTPIPTPTGYHRSINLLPHLPSLPSDTRANKAIHTHKLKEHGMLHQDTHPRATTLPGQTISRHRYTRTM